MTFLDILIAIPLGYLIFKGYRRGLVFEIASLAGIIIGSILAVRFANWFSNLLGLDGKNAYLVAFFIIFIGIVILSVMLARLTERFLKLVHVGLLNNIAGALLGMIKGVFIVGVFLYFLAFLDFKEKIITRDTKESSLLYEPVVKGGQRLVGKMECYVAQRKEQMK